MAKSRLPKSLRKYLRKEKARLRRESLNTQEAERKVRELVEATFEKYSKIKVLEAENKKQTHVKK